jgi:phosphatidylserine decarboxylase
MASPVDAKIIVFGEVTSDRVEHVKGVTYTASGFLGMDINSVKTRPGNRLYHCVLYLAPGDYHRIHSPVEWQVNQRRHFPGTLFPVAPTVTRLIPDLLALNERVVLLGKAQEGAFFSMSAVGAYNVGSIQINFDPEVKTNYITRDFRCENLRYLSYGGIGSKAYEKAYEPAIALGRGAEVGLFNLGSTVVLIFEAPAFTWEVAVGEHVKMGCKLGSFI